MQLKQIIAKLDKNYQPNGELSFDDLRIVWQQCEDSSKMLTLAGRLNIDKTIFVQIACKCARLILHLIPKGEDRPRLAIEAAEKWSEMPSKENANAAADAAAAAANAAYAAYAASAAYAAAYAAAYDVAYVAVHSADAAYYVGRIDISAGQKCAEIVREYIPFELIKLAVVFN